MAARLARTLVLLVAATMLVPEAHAQGPAPVGVDEVISEPMSQTAPVLGRIVARTRGDVAARVQGAVDEVHVSVGDRVEAGQSLATIDASWLMLTERLREAAYAESQSTVESAVANEQIARSSFNRLSNLRDSAAFSAARFEDAQQELLRATAALGAARSRVTRAEAELAVARLDLKYAEITAPYAGIIIERHAQPGSYLTVGSPVVTMLNAATLEVEADIPVGRTAALEPGQTVSIERAGGSTEATVRAVVPEENPMTRTRAVRFSASFEDSAPPAVGESVTVLVPEASGRVVTTVHKDAVVQQANGSIVYLVADGAAEARPVELGPAVGDRFEVTRGLEVGDVVVVRGNERLQPGQQVTF